MSIRAFATAILVSLLAVFGPGAAEAKRVALVIGNANYTNATALRNPANDAADMAEKLRGLGFETVEGYDLTYDDMRSTMRDFARIAHGAEIATIFYAGHGIAVDGVNYVLPVDASLDDPVDWEFQVFDLDEMLRLVRNSSRASLIFLDACRDNPLAATLAQSMGEGTRSISGRGLAIVDTASTGSGMAIAFATSPGAVAQDGDGRNSPFTAALLEHIGAPNTDITEVMSRVTGTVYEATGQAQRPWINASLTGPVMLNRVDVEPLEPSAPAAEAPASGSAPAAAASASVDVQKFMFDAARDSGDPADYRAYLDMFPDGLFAQLARNALERSAKPEPAADQVAAVTPEAAGTTQASAAPSVALTRTLAQPLTLSVTERLRVTPATEATETALALSRAQRRAIQGRLNAIGHNVGGADGVFGPRTRSGISAWQSQNGLVPTGFLNASQLELLTANSETQYQAWLASRPAQTTTTRRTSSSSQRRSNQGMNADAFIGGVIGGIIGGAIAR